MPSATTVVIPRRVLDIRPLSPDPLDRVWPPGWEEMLDTPFADGNVGPSYVLITPVSFKAIVTTDGEELTISRNANDEVIPIICVFQLARRHSDRLDARRFVLGMRVYCAFFTIQDRSATRVTAAGAWARRWMHWGGRGAAWSRCCSVHGFALRAYG